MTEAALAAAGVLALTEGVKFLYAQAGEALKWWRERKDRREDVAQKEELPVAAPPSAFPDAQRSVEFDSATIEQLESELRVLRTSVSDYVDGVEQIDPADTEFMTALNALRDAVEAVTSRQYTFAGETRPAEGPTVTGEAKVQEVKGRVVGLHARQVRSGRLAGTATATTVHEGGTVIGADVDSVG